MSQTVKEYRELDSAQLLIRIKDLKQKYLSLRESIRAGKEKNHAQLKFIKNEVARAQTILHEKQSS